MGVQRCARHRFMLAAQHGWLAPLPPEGASAIVYRDTDHAPELSAAQGIRSADLLRAGIVDAIVAEHPDAVELLPATVN